MKTELLAPAKDKETAIAAIDCGADAVYIGASAFGARKNAGNSLDDIKEVVNYAHKYWAKVFVTVNTLVKDDELEDAVNLVKDLDSINVDSILVQDMGLLKRLIELNLQIPIHASTQCDNRDIEKIKFFKNIGIKRVVLPRETSLEQIRDIHKAVPDIELEGFVHGALCVSYSGQCYLSQYIGGRSANRGECAQPCRKKYNLYDENGNLVSKNSYLLCLKDLNASNCIKEMIDNGIFSFKIEGRLKEIGYVKNVVSYYRRELDKYSEKISSGKSFISFVPDVERSFNRGFTEYFLRGRTDCYNYMSPKSIGKYIGRSASESKNGADFDSSAVFIKTDFIINPQDGLYFLSNGKPEGFLVNRVQKSKNGFWVYPNKKLRISKNTKIFRNYDAEFEKELEKPVKRKIEIKVELSDGNITIVDEDGVSISAPVPAGEIPKNKEKMNETFIKQFSKTGESDYYINKIVINCELPFITVGEINCLRRVLFEKLTEKRLSQYKRELQEPLKYSKFYKNQLDYRANIYNKEAELFYNKCGADSLEYCPEKTMPSRQIELMRTKHCIKYVLKMCKTSSKLFLEDEKGVMYPLIFDCKNCEMALLSPVDNVFKK